MGKQRKMTLPMTTQDVCIGRNVVEYDANWRPKKQPDWFDKLCEKLRILLCKDTIKKEDNTDNV